MKIIFLDQGEFLGGAEYFLLDFFGTLSPKEKKKISPMIIGAQNKIYQERLFKLGIPFKKIKYPAVRGNFLKQIISIFPLLQIANKINRHIKTEKGTHIFSNTPRAHFVFYLAKKMWNRCFWVAFFHDFTVPDFLVRRIAKSANILVANSVETRLWLRQRIDPKYYHKIRIVENGINFEALPEAPPPKEIKKILMISRIDPRKGQMFALQAANFLLERNPELHFSFAGEAVVGDTRTTNYKKECEVFVQERGLTNVSFLGEKNPLEVIPDHDLCLFLPTEPETFGRVVIESLALNRLVLAFDQVGPRATLDNFFQFLCSKDHLKEGPNPFLVKTNKALDLAEKIATIADNPPNYIAYGVLGSNFVKKQYNLVETKKSLLAAFQI